ncbi:MAG: hypothetical protein KME16_23880 [Scytolyngbya sp. HA4215-MV1]|jgi:pantoate kinase|nr:hypothetical protein [Scytolyngbya sp. HA4215-MV1]
MVECLTQASFQNINLSGSIGIGVELSRWVKTAVPSANQAIGALKDDVAQQRDENEAE